MSSHHHHAAKAGAAAATTAEQHRQLDESVLAVARRHAAEHGATQDHLTGSAELRSVPLEALVQSLNRLLRAERLVAVRGPPGPGAASSSSSAAAAAAAAGGGVMRYRVPTAADARTRGLGNEERMVLQRVREGGNAGVWTKDLRQRTNLSQPQVARVLKALEARGLVKAVKGVAHPSRKLFMLAELEPSREITGGAWYINNEFDEDFIAQLRLVCLKYVGGLARGAAATVADVAAFVRASGVFGVELQAEDVAVVLDTLYYDNLLDKLTAEEALAEARAHGVALQLEVEEEGLGGGGGRATGGKRRRQAPAAAAAVGPSSSSLEESDDDDDERSGGSDREEAAAHDGGSSSDADEEEDDDDDDAGGGGGGGKKRRRAKGGGGGGGKKAKGGAKKGRAAQPASSSGGGSLSGEEEEEDDDEPSRSETLDSDDSGGEGDDDEDEDEEGGFGGARRRGSGRGGKGRKGGGRKKGLDDADDRHVSRTPPAAAAAGASAARYRLAAHPLPPASESALLEAPCGACPVAHECREGAQVAPQSCAYFRDWLDF